MHALLVIDMQVDFCPGGALAVPEGDALVAPVNALMAETRDAGEAVILTQDWHPRGHGSFASEHPDHGPFEMIEMPYGDQILWPDHCIIGSPGAEFHPELDTDLAELVVRKGFRREIDSYSAFFENDHATPTGLSGYLHARGIERLTLCGLALDFCVAYSALDAAKLGFETTVRADLCRAIDTDGSLDSAGQAMVRSGVKLKR